MSDSEEPANLADMVRARAKARGNAIVYEFEGRQTSFAEFDIRTNRVANALKALGVNPRERIAYLGKNSDIYFELLLGAMKANVVMAPVNWRLAGPEIAFIVDDCKAPVLFVGPEFVTQVAQHQAAIARPSHRHHHRRRRAGMAGLHGLARRAERRGPEGPDQPARTSRSSSTPRAPQANPKARCCRTPIFSIWWRPAGTRSPTGTNGPRTMSRWWRCRSSISAAPAGA